MKVNDPNLTPAGGSQQASRAANSTRVTTAGGLTAGGPTTGAAAGISSNDDVHLSELVRSLRSLAADSPERQAKIENLARTYATGNYKVDAEATASAMIDDAFQH
jgi:flagellar biosynthesis anti-sigma factor FlgM